MCVIILSKSGKLPDKDKFRIAHENNPDGFGVMWSENGQAKTIHGLFSFDECWETLESLQDIPWCMHLRFMTAGRTQLSQCHPFQVSSKDQTGRDIWMVHNGTMFWLSQQVKTYGGSKSDTEVFAEGLREALRRYDEPDKVLFSEPVKAKMLKKLESYNKLVFMTDKGHFEIFNEGSGRWLSRNMWSSNTYSFIPGYRTVQKQTKQEQEDALADFLGDFKEEYDSLARSDENGFRGYVTRAARRDLKRQGRDTTKAKERSARMSLVTDDSKYYYDPRFNWGGNG